MGCAYCITFPNGKKYIGICSVAKAMYWAEKNRIWFPYSDYPRRDS